MWIDTLSVWTNDDLDNIQDIIQWMDENNENKTQVREKFEKLKAELEQDWISLEDKEKAYEEFKEALDSIEDEKIKEILNIINWIQSELDNLQTKIDQNDWQVGNLESEKENTRRLVNESFIENWTFEKIEDIDFMDDPGKFFENVMNRFVNSLISSIDSMASFSFFDKNFEIFSNDVKMDKISKFFEKKDYINKSDIDNFSNILNSLSEYTFFWDWNLLQNLDNLDLNSLDWIDDNQVNRELFSKLLIFIKENLEYINKQYPENEKKSAKFDDIIKFLFNNPVANQFRDYAVPSIWIKIPSKTKIEPEIKTKKEWKIKDENIDDWDDSSADD